MLLRTVGVFTVVLMGVAGSVGSAPAQFLPPPPPILPPLFRPPPPPAEVETELPPEQAPRYGRPAPGALAKPRPYDPNGPIVSQSSRSNSPEAVEVQPLPPPSGYRENYPQQGYGQRDPQQGYPQQGYPQQGNPQQGYRDPQPGYRDPPPGYREAAPGYRDPQPIYRETAPGYREPPPGYEPDPRVAPGRPTYGSQPAPGPLYGAPTTLVAPEAPGPQQAPGPQYDTASPGPQEAVRPPMSIGPGGRAPEQEPVVASLPPEDRPETGPVKELPAHLRRAQVDYRGKEPAGTIVIDTQHTYLYFVQGGGKAMRYGIGVGREGFTWAGAERVSRMAEWPDWHPPAEMIERQPYLPRFMAGGEGNPLGARALYLGKTLYRIHGTNQPSTIGTFVSSGCIRLTNEDITDLFGRVQVGTRVVVMPGKPPATAAAGGRAGPQADATPPQPYNPLAPPRPQRR